MLFSRLNRNKLASKPLQLEIDCRRFIYVSVANTANRNYVSFQGYFSLEPMHEQLFSQPTEKLNAAASDNREAATTITAKIIIKITKKETRKKKILNKIKNQMCSSNEVVEGVGRGEEASGGFCCCFLSNLQRISGIFRLDFSTFSNDLKFNRILYEVTDYVNHCFRSLSLSPSLSFLL